MNRRAKQFEIAEAGPVLTASEISAFTYCPEAWVLDRLHASQTSASRQRLRDGAFSHKQIGHRVDRLSVLDGACRLAGAAIVVLALLLALQATGVSQVPHP